MSPSFPPASAIPSTCSTSAPEDPGHPDRHLHRIRQRGRACDLCPAPASPDQRRGSVTPLVTVVNLTAHPVTLADGNGRFLRTWPAASGRTGAVRPATTPTLGHLTDPLARGVLPVRHIDAAALTVDAIPAPRSGRYWIVSRSTALVARRGDLLVPGPLDRSESYCTYFETFCYQPLHIADAVACVPDGQGEWSDNHGGASRGESGADMVDSATKDRA